MKEYCRLIGCSGTGVDCPGNPQCEILRKKFPDIQNEFTEELLKGCSDMKKIKCDSHGKVEWKRHLICTECERVYDEKKSEMIVHLRANRCYCGALFAPTIKNDEVLEDQNFSARPICPQCYQNKIKQKRGF